MNTPRRNASSKLRIQKGTDTHAKKNIGKNRRPARKMRKTQINMTTPQGILYTIYITEN